MSDKRDAIETDGAVKPGEKSGAGPEAEPHKVDEAVQEEAGKERTENEGYD